jgi:hypothetical protein
MLSEELGVHQRLLYKWRDQMEPIDDGRVRRGTRVRIPGCDPGCILAESGRSGTGSNLGGASADYGISTAAAANRLGSAD